MSGVHVGGGVKHVLCVPPCIIMLDLQLVSECWCCGFAEPLLPHVLGPGLGRGYECHHEVSVCQWHTYMQLVCVHVHNMDLCRYGGARLGDRTMVSYPLHNTITT